MTDPRSGPANQGGQPGGYGPSSGPPADSGQGNIGSGNMGRGNRGASSVGGAVFVSATTPTHITRNPMVLPTIDAGPPV